MSMGLLFFDVVDLPGDGDSGLELTFAATTLNQVGLGLGGALGSPGCSYVVFGATTGLIYASGTIVAGGMGRPVTVDVYGAAEPDGITISLNSLDVDSHTNGFVVVGISS